MNRKLIAVAGAALVALGAAGLLAQQDFDLPGRTKEDIPDVPVPPVPPPECVSCPDGYHCNDAKDGCEADAPPPKPEPAPAPKPEPDPPQPDEGTTDVPPP